MKCFFNPALVIFICFMSSNLFAEQLVCPKSIEIKESAVNVPKGWAVSSEKIPHRLKGIEFFYGDPEKRLGIPPEQETIKNDVLYSTWEFDNEAKDLWMICTYGRTNLTLKRPVNKSYSLCTVKSNMTIKIDGDPELMSVDCK